MGECDDVEEGRGGSDAVDSEAHEVMYAANLSMWYEGTDSTEKVEGKEGNVLF